MELIAEVLASISWPHLLLIWLVVVFAAVMRAFTGFGFALVAVPVFSLFMPPTQAVVLSVSLTLAVSLSTLKTFWGQYPLGALRNVVLLAGVGTVIGTVVLATISLGQFQLMIGVLVILASLALTFYKPQEKRPRPMLGNLAGLTSGLMNGVFAIPGPPVIIYAVATESEPARSRAFLMTFFLFSAAIGLASFGVAGFVTPHAPILFLLAYPAMSLGDKLGYYLFKRYGTAAYRRVALLVLFAVGISISARALLV